MGYITKACLHLFTTVEYTLQNTEKTQPVAEKLSETIEFKHYP